MNDYHPANRTELFLRRIFVSYCLFFFKALFCSFGSLFYPVILKSGMWDSTGPFKTHDRPRRIEISYRPARSTDKKKKPLGRSNVPVARKSLPLPFDQALATSDQPLTTETLRNYHSARASPRKIHGRGNVLVAHKSHMRAAGTLPRPFDQIPTTSG